MIRAFSYGGGIQSTAALILAAHGKIDFKTFLFCNVGADSENPKTLEYVHNVAIPYAAKHGIEFVELHKTLKDGTRDTIYQRLTRPHSRSIGIPVRMNGNGAPGRRSCTCDFKIAVVDKELKARGAKESGALVGIGFTWDERQRCKPNTDLETIKWKELCFPLISDMSVPLTRQDCINLILEELGYLPDKSACVFCPYHSLLTWQQMRTNEPAQFWYCVALERFINDRRKTLGLNPAWFCSKLKPLDEATTDYVQETLFQEPDSCSSGWCFL